MAKMIELNCINIRKITFVRRGKMYDFILKNGLIVDGTRRIPFKGSIGIQGDRISKITDEEECEGNCTIDCEGKIISPGFIDIHSHSDACPLNLNKAQSKVNQGITLELNGNCGISLMPCNDSMREEIMDFFRRTIEIDLEDKNLKINSMEDYRKLCEKKNFIINNAILIGHGTLRACVIGFDDRKATAEEIEKMKALLHNELKNGAFGMSLGLIYPPSSYAGLEELVELAKVIKEYDGILSVHMRSESDLVFEAVDEMIEVAQKSGVHLEISHLKLIGKPQWGRSKELLDKIKEAKEKGCNITCDQYPYEATSTGLSALVPAWAHDGGNSKMLERIATHDPKIIKDIISEMDRRGGAKCVGVSSTHNILPEIEGKNIEEISKMYNLSPEDTVIKVLLDTKGDTAAIYYSLNLDDVINIMKEMYISVGSDGYNFNYDLKFNPHPRSFGTFPKFLEMIRENNLMPIEDAVYKITGLPADVMGLKDRGVLKEGNIADITVFDYEEIKDMSTFLHSPVRPRGIYDVFISGEPAILNGHETGKIKGSLILKK